MVRVSIQGDAASFHDIAARTFFDGGDYLYCASFSETMDALKAGADYAVCAIENSLYGSINEVYDLINGRGLFIIGEIYLRVEQCLIGLPGADISKASIVHSHPVALAQCEAYLDTTMPTAERAEYHDTAASVAFIKEMNDPTQFAIASADAAKLHGVEIFAHSIETNKQNFTRFVVLRTSHEPTVTEPNKSSLIVRTDHTPGALYKALGCFAKNGINLSKIQSRPIIGKAWHYMFYVDIDAGSRDPRFTDASNSIKRLGYQADLLGTYMNGRSENALS